MSTNYLKTKLCKEAVPPQHVFFFSTTEEFFKVAYPRARALQPAGLLTVWHGFPAMPQDVVSCGLDSIRDVCGECGQLKENKE